MNRLLLFLAVCIGFSGGYMSAQDRHDSHRGHEAYGRQGHHCRSSYLISNNDVFFEGKKISGASALGFSILRDGYAEDTWYTYYYGRKIN